MSTRLGQDFEVDAWSRFWKWNVILGSVVPLAMFYRQIVGSSFSTTKDDSIVQFFRLLNVTFTAPVLFQIIENVARLFLMMKALCRQHFNICEYLTVILHSLLFHKCSLLTKGFRRWSWSYRATVSDIRSFISTWNCVLQYNFQTVEADCEEITCF